ncbi:MAG: GGDEF domain-containing protein [Gemmatimonadota bacterium]|nr:GGDEF domain-containing protein [Gemmatimonadota bacterium]
MDVPRAASRPAGPATATPPVPPRALWLSGLALVVAAAASLLWPDALRDYAGFAWMLALVPPFLLAHYNGWKGAAAGLAAALLVLIGLEVVAAAVIGRPVDWRLAAVTAGLFAAVSVGAGISAEALQRRTFRALQLAYVDSLTGLGNRRVIDFFLAHQVAGARRGGSVAVAIFDLDDFKTWNDRFGHAAGDEALEAFGRTLSASTRASDLSGRIGGEEFLTVLAGGDATGAERFAERVRQAFRAEEFSTGSRLSVSAGIAAAPPLSADAEALVRAADAALYAAKRAGKDRVVRAGRDTPPPREAESRRRI